MDIQDIDRVRLINLINTRRKERGLSAVKLAEALGLSPRTVIMILQGTRLPSATVLAQLLQIVEISEDEIPRITQPMPRPAGKHIFISYSHRDSAYLDRLMVHLKPLQRQGLIDPWVDTKLLAGEKWKKEIEKALKNARVAVLLISADFLASDFIVENELPPLLHNAEEKGTLIIPVILKSCRFTRDKNLREFQSINSPDEPLSLADENERELIYDTIAQRIEDVMGK